MVQNGQGQISLSCYNCTNPVATALSPSGGCYSDIQVYVSYGGYTSNAFNVTIVAPSITYLESVAHENNNYPGPIYGWMSFWTWRIVDSCGALNGGLDANETFGAFVHDTPNNWIYSSEVAAYLTSYLVIDFMAHIGGTPATQNPGSPTLGTVKVRHNYPYAIRGGSQSFGSGTPVRVDTQQQYTDHGAHF